MTTDDLIQEIIDKEDELTQKYNVIIEQEVRKHVLKKFGNDAEKYLDSYYNDSDLEEDPIDCPECEKTAKEALSNVSAVSKNINMLSNEFINQILETAFQNNDIFNNEIISKLQSKLKNTMFNLGYQDIEINEQEIIPLYLLKLSILVTRKAEADDVKSERER